MFFGIRICYCLILLCGSLLSSAQDISIKVLDTEGTPVEAAQVVLSKDKLPLYSALTSALGHAELNIEDTGNYSILVQHLSYSRFVRDISYVSQPLLLTIVLNRSIATDSLTIIGKTMYGGSILLDERQYKLMPASFQDPARVLIKYPGFTTTNDQSNAMRFRGFSAETIQWQLMGADIVNPNHLSNTGTIDDFSTVNAGGVNAISGSALGMFRFISNPSSISFGNIMSGSSQLNYSESINSFAEFSLIGPEVGLNINSGNKNTYILGRYSFVGLLEKMGVSFGNESINYIDASIYTDLIKNDHNSLKAYFTIGQSSNLHNPADSIAQFKDIQTIDFNSKLLISGLQYKTISGNGKSLSSTLNYSLKKDRWERFIDDNYIPLLNAGLISPEYYNLTRTLSQSILSNHTQYKIVEKNQLSEIGLRVNLNRFNNENTPNLGVAESSGSISFITLYPYLSRQWSLDRWILGLGIASLYDNLQNNWSAEPWINSKYIFNKIVSTEFSYRYSTRMLNEFFYILPSGGNDLRRLAGHHLQMDLRVERKNTLMTIGVFYHSMDGQIAAFSDVNTLNLSEGYQPVNHLPVRSLGKNLNIPGSEVFVNHIIYKGKGNLELNFNASYFFRNEFFYEWEQEYTTNATVKWEKRLNNSGNKRFSIWLNYHQSTTPFGTSQDFGSYLYGLQLMSYGEKSRYSRWDFRFNYIFPMSSGKLKARISLDIQNLSGTENEFFRYYDFINEDFRIQRSLGLIPVLAFRIERAGK